MKKIIILLVLTAAIFVFLLGFIDRSYLEPVKSKADITYSINTMPQNLKAVGSLTKREQDIICAVSRGLIEVDINGEIIPSLAESVDVKDGGIEYDFKIRDDIYWSDGSKITPKDIVSFFREVITEEDESDIDGVLNIFGARDYKESYESFSEQVGISATEHYVNIRLNSIDKNFLEELSKPQYRIRKNVLLWENIKDCYVKLVYSGNYAISDMEENQIVLTRNSKSDTKLAQTIHIVKDNGEDLALAAFEVGNRDIVVNPPESQLERLNKENKLITLPSNRSLYLIYNSNNELLPLSGKREIYNWMTKALEEYQYKNKESMELAEGSYFRQNNGDLDKLQERKVMSNVDEEWQIPGEVTLIAEENLKNKEMVQYLSKWFLDNTDLVLNTTLVQDFEVKTLKEKNYYDLALVEFPASIENKSLFYDFIDPYLPNNLAGKIVLGISPEEEEVIYTQIEDTLFNTYSILPLIFYNDNIAINTHLKNIELDGNGNLTFNMIKK